MVRKRLLNFSTKEKNYNRLKWSFGFKLLLNLNVFKHGVNCNNDVTSLKHNVTSY